MTAHWEGCWRDEGHPACRLARILALEAERRRPDPRGETSPPPVPTWAAPADEPPAATPEEP